MSSKDSTKALKKLEENNQKSQLLTERIIRQQESSSNENTPIMLIDTLLEKHNSNIQHLKDVYDPSDEHHRFRYNLTNRHFVKQIREYEMDLASDKYFQETEHEDKDLREVREPILLRYTTIYERIENLKESFNEFGSRTIEHGYMICRSLLIDNMWQEILTGFFERKLHQEMRMQFELYEQIEDKGILRYVSVRLIREWDDENECFNLESYFVSKDNKDNCIRFNARDWFILNENTNLERRQAIRKLHYELDDLPDTQCDIAAIVKCISTIGEYLEELDFG